MIYGAGKTAGQIVGICRHLADAGAYNHPHHAAGRGEGRRRSAGRFARDYDPVSKIAVAAPREIERVGSIAVATGGTSDMPVAEEAALTAEALGSHVVRLYDVGVAGLHRLLAQLDELHERPRGHRHRRHGGRAGQRAWADWSSCPVVAVPTSVGYGASFGGVAALLSMLNSCASGVSVVNIDNGFGAGFLASTASTTMEGIR